MTREDFSIALYDFHLHHANGINSLEKLIKKASRYFINKLNDLDEEELNHAKIDGRKGIDKKANLVKECNRIIHRSTIDILKYKDTMGNEGFDDFYDIFFPSQKPSDAANIKTVHPCDFYRMRKADNEYELYDRKGLFIIPSEHENLIGRQRFNIEGKPCLYLASNLYIAWEECRRPNFNFVNFSRFYNVNKLRVMSINIAPSMNTVGDFIMGYFTLLCSMKTHDKDKFKFQYIVPNLFMKVLFWNIQQGGNVDGIRYLSSRRFECDDFLLDPNDIDDVYVFPPKTNPDKGICPELKEMFRMTKPRTYSLYKAHRFSFDTRKTNISNYQDSLFAEIERQLKNEDLDYYDK